jgi:hypothetical protein
MINSFERIAIRGLEAGLTGTSRPHERVPPVRSLSVSITPVVTALSVWAVSPVLGP